jgi:hypothetical protein
MDDMCTRTELSDPPLEHSSPLLDLPVELLVKCLLVLDTGSCARLARAGRRLHGPLEAALRQRAPAAAGAFAEPVPPLSAAGCIPALLCLERRRSLTREVVAAGDTHVCFLDNDSRLLTCGVENNMLRLTGHGLGAAPTWGIPRPTIVRRLDQLRVLAITASRDHSLAVVEPYVLYS